MRVKLKSLMKSRVRPLIVAAFGNQTPKVDHAVEELATKVLALKNASEVMPLVAAMRLPPSHAADLMAAWVGITYFEHEYSLVHKPLQEVAGFLNSRLSEKASLTRVHREEIFRNAEFVRSRLKGDWATIRNLSIEYKTMYEGLVFHGDIMGFRNFLLKCKTSYWALGDLLGRLEQIVIAWNVFSKTQRSDIPVGAVIDFLLVLRTLNTSVPIKTAMEGPGVTAESAPLAVELT